MADETRIGLPPDSPLDHPAVPADLLRPPAGFVEALEYGDQELRPACAECDAILQGICGEVEGEVAPHESAVATTCRTLVGEVRAALDDAHGEARKVADKLIKTVSDRISNAAGDVASAGVNYPFDPNLQSALLSTDPLEWLGVAVPELGQLIGSGGGSSGGGSSFPPEACPALQRICEVNPTDPLCVELENCPPPVPIPPDPPCPFPNPWMCDSKGGPIGDGGPTDPPPPPAPPPTCELQCPPPTVLATCPQPIVNVSQPCPAPPDVSVVVGGDHVLVNVGQGGKGDGQTSTSGQGKGLPAINMSQQQRQQQIVNIPEKEPKPEEGPNGKLDPRPEGPGAKLNWTTLAPCFELPDWIIRLEDRVLVAGGGGAKQVPLNEGLWNQTIGPLLQWIKRPRDNEVGGLAQVAGAVLAAPASLVSGAWDLAISLFDVLAPGQLTNPTAARYFGGRLGMAKWAERISGFPMDYCFTGDLYAFQYANPMYLPPQGAVDTLYVMGRINEDMWTCWTRAQGNIPEWARLYRDTLFGRPTLDELVHMRWRRILPTDLAYIEAAQRIGVGADWAMDALKLKIQIPTQTDLLRMMVRDSADDAVALKYGYDTDFLTKFAGPLRLWAEAQGIPAEIFRYYWRAHWVIPSNTQLYEMFQRFRPDRPEVQAWDEFAAVNGEIGAIASLGPRPIVVTLGDVREALQINDNAPGWIDGLIGIAYHPLTRTDAVRAFEIGAFDSEKLYHIMRDNGYNEPDARTLVRFYQQQAERRASNATGVLTIRKAVKFYKTDAITRLQAEQALSPLIPNPARIQELLNRALMERGAEELAAVIAQIKKAYFAGELGDQELQDALQLEGVEAVRAADLRIKWATLKRYRRKVATAAQLCKWYKSGLLTDADYTKRLKNLGHSEEDIKRIKATCAMSK